MENINDIIQRKIFALEQFLSEIKELAKKSKSLPRDKITEIPITISDWSEEKVKKHIETVREAVIYPIRHLNKNKLENIGITTGKIPESIFDNTILIDKVVELLEGIKKISDLLMKILFDEHLIEKWLLESSDEIEQKLQGIIDAEISLKEIIKKEIINEKFKCEILKRTLEDAIFLEKAEEIISNIEYLNRFGVLLDYTGEFGKFCENLDKTSDKAKDIVGNYGIPENEIKQKIEKKELSDAYKIIETLESECAERKRKLMDECKIYESTLKSFGDEILEPPKTIPELEKFVDSMREKCLGHLGELGFKLLKFLRGEEEFPEDIEVEGIKKALEALRPLFLKSIKEED